MFERTSYSIEIYWNDPWIFPSKYRQARCNYQNQCWLLVCIDPQQYRQLRRDFSMKGMRLKMSFAKYRPSHASMCWYIDGLAQDCSNSSALSMELLQSCAKPSISSYVSPSRKCKTESDNNSSKDLKFVRHCSIGDNTLVSYLAPGEIWLITHQLSRYNPYETDSPYQRSPDMDHKECYVCPWGCFRKFTCIRIPPCIGIWLAFPVTSRERHGLSDHRQLDCLFNTFKLTTNISRHVYIYENNKAPHYWPFVKGIHRWPVDSPHKGSVKREAFPCYNVILLKEKYSHTYKYVWWTNLSTIESRFSTVRYSRGDCPVVALRSTDITVRWVWHGLGQV